MKSDVSVFIITDDRQYIPADEYDRGLDGKGVFVMLTNECLDSECGNDNSICIYGKWSEMMRSIRLSGSSEFDERSGTILCRWQNNHDALPGIFKLNEHTDKNVISSGAAKKECLMRYVDGYRTNQDIMRCVRRIYGDESLDLSIEAIMISCHTSIMFDGEPLRAYLPSIGQLVIIDSNIDKINKALCAMDGKNTTFHTRRMFYSNYTHGIGLEGGWWSVTPYNDRSVWQLHDG